MPRHRIRESICLKAFNPGILTGNRDLIKLQKTLRKSRKNLIFQPTPIKLNPFAEEENRVFTGSLNGR
jgi:hypothetical protein